MMNTKNEAFLSFRYTDERRSMLEQIMHHLLIPGDSWGAKSQALDWALRTATASLDEESSSSGYRDST
jgi:hypothetical protein